MSAESNYDKTKPRVDYENRRQAIEDYFLKNPLDQEILEMAGGAKVKVLSKVFELPESLKKPKTSPEDPDRVTIFVPGMFEAAKPNFGNHPLEVKLLGGILTGDIDKILVIKAEGLNTEAYKGSSQQLVSKAAVRILKKDLAVEGQANNLYSIVGHSEGGSQATSIAARILEDPSLGKVAELINIGGLGIDGVETQNDATLANYLKKVFRKNHLSPPSLPYKSSTGTNLYHQLDGDNLYVSKRLIGGEAGSYEDILGKAKVGSLDDLYNVGVWISKLATGSGVPQERLRALWSQNPDNKILAFAGVPMIVFIGHKSLFFPYQEVKESIDELRDGGAKILMISSDTAHDFSHHNPSGLALFIEFARRRWHKTDQISKTTPES